MGDQSGDRRKSKNKAKYGQNLKKKKFVANALEANQKGFVLTCSLDEKRALIECYNILDKIMQQIQDEKNQNESNKPTDNVDDELNKELEELKAVKPFRQVKTECKFVLFIKLNRPELDPIEIMNKIFTTIESDQSINCRFICKMIPIVNTLEASQGRIITGLRNILKEDLNEELTYRIELNTRMNNKIKRDDLIPAIAEMVQEIKPKWTVNLTSPIKVILVDVMHMIAGITILDHYFERNKYNLKEFLMKFKEPEDSEKDLIENKTESADEKNEIEKVNDQKNESIERELEDEKFDLNKCDKNVIEGIEDK